MTILQSAILGLVQGLGEFLPISSSGHLLLTRLLMGIQSEDPAFKILDILLHVGTLLPVMVVFWREWLHMLRHPIKDRTLLLLFLASMPTLAIYLVFDMDIFNNGWFLGVSFLITALLLVITEAFSHTRRKWRDQVHLPNALCMGVMQGLGMLPGVSRSGSTIFGGVLSGLNRETAARFSFMMSAPAIAGALLVEGKHALDDGLFSHLNLVPTAVGIAVAAVTGFIAIKLMLKLITRISLHWFALYLALIGLAYLALQLIASPLVPAFQIPAAVVTAAV